MGTFTDHQEAIQAFKNFLNNNMGYEPKHKVEFKKKEDITKDALRVNDKDKSHVGVVICGHVDAGKSTTTGNLLFQLGTMDDRVKEKLVAEAEAEGKGSFAFAYFMDRQKEERKRGVTISCTRSPCRAPPSRCARAWAA